MLRSREYSPGEVVTHLDLTLLSSLVRFIAFRKLPFDSRESYDFLCQAKYIAQCIEEIKQELRQDNVAVKANAVAKLTYVSLAQRSMLI